MCAARRPCEGIDGVGVSVVNNDVAAGERIPDMDSFVATGCYAFPVGRPRKGFYGRGMPRLLCMTTIGENCSSSTNIPDLYRPVVTGRGDIRPIGRPRERLNRLSMTAITCVNGGVLPAGGIPDLHGV